MVTQVADIIIYSLDDFFNQKPDELQNTLEVSVKLKIDSILNTYDCFKDVHCGAPVLHYPRQEGQQRHFKPRVHHHHNVPLISPIAKLKASTGNDSCREMRAMLNKISVSNYDTIIKKIIRKIDAENLQEIIQEVVKKAIEENFYTHVYASILEKVIISHGGEAKRILDEILLKLMQQIPSKLRDISLSNFTLDNYDNFCLVQKEKNFILGTNTFLIQMLCRNMASFAEHDLYDVLHQGIAMNMGTHELMELTAQMMLDFFKHVKDEKLIVHMRSFYDENILPVANNKTKFKIFEIFEFLEKNRKV